MSDKSHFMQLGGIIRTICAIRIASRAKNKQNYVNNSKKLEVFCTCLTFFQYLCNRLFDVFGEFDTANVFANSYHQDCLRRAKGGENRNVKSNRGGQHRETGRCLYNTEGMTA